MSRRGREMVVAVLGALPGVAILAWIGVGQGPMMLLAFLGGSMLALAAVAVWLLFMGRVERWAKEAKR